MEKNEDASSSTTRPGHSSGEDNKDSRSSSSPETIEVPGGNYPETSSDIVSKEKEYEYLTGFKLAAVLFSTTLVAFLMLLDTSVVSTVSFHTTPVRSAFS